MLKRAMSGTGRAGKLMARALATAALMAIVLPGCASTDVMQNPQPATTQPATSAPGAPFTAAELTALLPPSVYFSGQSAPLQLRNAGGTRFGTGAVIWAALVDTSGYASSIQNKYQFYFVTESPIQFGGERLPAGAYGAGFVGNDRFLVMDIGGHTVVEGQTKRDDALKRPRPLEILPEAADRVRLYLGRRWVMLQAAPH